MLKPKKRKKKAEKLTKDDEKVEEFFIQENDEITNEFETTFEENNFEDMDVEPSVEE